MKKNSTDFESIDILRQIERKEREYMDIKVNDKIIKEMCGTVSFKRGDSFYRANKVTFNQYSSDFCEATVNGTEDFHVTIEKDVTGDIGTNCSCPTLPNFQQVLPTYCGCFISHL